MSSSAAAAAKQKKKRKSLHDFSSSHMQRKEWIAKQDKEIGVALPYRAKLMILTTFTVLEGEARGRQWQRTAELLQVSKSSIREVLLEFEQHGCIVTSNTNIGNRITHTRFLHSPLIIEKILSYVRDKQRTGRRAFAVEIQKDVLTSLGIHVHPRTLCRTLNRFGLLAKLDDEK